MSVFDDLARRIERWSALDRAADPLATAVARAVRPGPVRDLLSGAVLGHPLHPLLTDVPIGAWTMAGLLDLVGGRAAAPAADVLVATGVVAAVPTAATGLHDWSDTRGAPRRVGLVHAAANSAALGLYTASLLARLRGRRTAGKALGLAGLGALTAGGYLGGHLSYVEGVGVNRTAWRRGPARWTDVAAAGELPEGEPRRVVAGRVSLVLVREGERIHALDSVCSHMGGPLDEGEVAGGCVRCPWHGSVFRLVDGSVVHGPATSPQPAYETRVEQDRVQVRARPR
ncbi:Rieske (2Fe-2S) protein [Kocuria sp. LUK]|uniref:Rieske (2Fe-2S) protein n=1 Tax=Kocuria sp. LUK TaxID=2897828 RepID=UPI001E4A3F4B|nr:Rieske (2Fe-2S) protein [Kocuria sp. LUK]MCD1143695.1 Rieske (2Fe-2S) protein [Kocuria sp. LUK]